MVKTGIIILAAGDSSRIGRPKQLLPYGDKTLLWHVAVEALGAFLGPVVVVTGAYHKEIEDSLREQSVEFAYNPDWQTGMASSIVRGLLKALQSEPNLRAVIVAVCDQPNLSAGVFRSLIENYSVSGKGLIPCRYAEAMGTPVLFDKKYFSELSELTGETGAKQLLKRYPNDVSAVAFPGGEIDVDTEEDFRKLRP